MKYNYETYKAKLEKDLLSASDLQSEYGCSEKEVIQMDLFYLESDSESILKCVNCEAHDGNGNYMCQYCANGDNEPPC
jgi:hypothetical protein